MTNRHDQDAQICHVDAILYEIKLLNCIRFEFLMRSLKNLFFLLWMAGMPGALFAQHAEIVGKVVDGITGLSIPFARVQIESSGSFTSADSTGHFTMKDLPEQEVIIAFSADLYETFADKFRLDAKQILNIKAQLRPLIYFDPAKVTPKRIEKNSHTTSILRDPNMVLEGEQLKRMSQSCSNFDSFLLRIANFLGARYEGSFYFPSSSARAARPQAAIVMVNGDYITDNYNTLPFLPRNVTRVEIYKPNSAGVAILGSRGYGGAINLFYK